MHGRLRVKTTAQQEAEKAAERQKKLAKYNAGVALLCKKRESGVYDEETALQLSQILAVNPDFYSMWNYRREIFLHWEQSQPADYMRSMLRSDLQFTEQCLAVNPKSYCAWHHRGWVMEHMPQPDWEAEIALCDKYLQLDSRNFHCWDYRRLAAAAAGRRPADELGATDRLIARNFSNYSSWHYRSQLLGQLHPPAAAEPTPVAQVVYNRELELVQSAAFTDPNDQAPWFYHRWLLQWRRTADAVRNCVSFASQEMVLVVVTLTQADRPEDLELAVVGGDRRLKEWKSPAGEPVDTVWVCEVPGTAGTALSVEWRSADGARKQRSVVMATDHAAAASADATLDSDVSAATAQILNQELDNIRQLEELEPDNKWVTLSRLVLMWALEPALHERSILESVALLMRLDPLRAGYYRDLKSRFLAERALVSQLPYGRHLDLSARELAVLYHTERMVTVATLDVDNNQLTTLDLRHLVAASRVSAIGNKLRTVRLPARWCSSLVALILDDNDIRSVDDLELLGDASVEVLSLKGNPVCEVPEFKSCILERFPHLKELNGVKL